jgi:hypothetical protein
MGWSGWFCALALALPLTAVAAELPAEPVLPVEIKSAGGAAEGAARGASEVPAKEPLPRVDPLASAGLVPFGDIKLQLELGRWNVDQINHLLARAQAEYPDANQRYTFLTEQFRRTPFEYEAGLPIPPPGVLRVRLASFDCTGLVIYALAMNNASSFEQFIHALRKIRYWQSETKGVDSDPVRGTILDFAEDILITHASQQGFLRNVTTEVADAKAIKTFRTRIQPWRREHNEDPDRRLVLPKLSTGRVLNLQMISRKAFARMDRSRIKSGDILLFSRVVPGRLAKKQLMFEHATVAMNQDGEIYMLHASRDYIWRADARPGDEPRAAGVYYLNDPRREQLGVGMATHAIKDRRGRRIRIRGKMYHGYATDRLRPVYDYLAGTRIQGVAVLRPTNMTPETKAHVLTCCTEAPAAQPTAEAIPLQAQTARRSAPAAD